MEGVISSIAGLFVFVLWVLCIFLSHRKPTQIGANVTFWVIVTMIFNLWGIIALYLYSIVKGTCKACGHIKKKDAK